MRQCKKKYKGKKPETELNLNAFDDGVLQKTLLLLYTLSAVLVFLKHVSENGCFRHRVKK
jgi:hypothetical protein